MTGSQSQGPAVEARKTWHCGHCNMSMYTGIFDISAPHGRAVNATNRASVLEPSRLIREARHVRKVDAVQDVYASDHPLHEHVAPRDLSHASFRSEERRVGKECRSRWSADH